MAKYLIARAKVLDESGEEIPVDVRTCAEAVTCNEGKTAQDHFKTLSDHMADTVAHPTLTRQAEWDAKETPAGAQTKADAAVDKATAKAQAIVTQQFPEAVRIATSNAQTLANNAKADAITAAAIDATAKLNAFASGKAFVTEQGSVDGWNYRKWSNGTIEAWAEIEAEVKLAEILSVASGVSFIRGQIAEQTIPAAIGFASAPFIQVDLSCDNSYVWGATTTPSGNDKTPAVTVMAWHTLASAVAAVKVKYRCISR